jgi:IS66 C-terminal element
MIQTAKLNGLEPGGHLRDVLVRISSRPHQLD